MVANRGFAQWNQLRGADGCISTDSNENPVGTLIHSESWGIVEIRRSGVLLYSKLKTARFLLAVKDKRLRQGFPVEVA